MIVFLFIYPNFAGKDREIIGIIQILRQLSAYLECKQGFPCRFSTSPTSSYRKKRLRTTPQAPRQSLARDVIDSGQRPPFIKVFLYGSQSLCPFGASHDLYLALRATIRIIYCHAKTLGERRAARGRQPRRAGQFYRVIQFSRRMPWKRWKSLVLSVTQIISLFIAVQAIKRSKLSSHGVPAKRRRTFSFAARLIAS